MTSEAEAVPNSGASTPGPRRARGVKLFIRDIILIFLAAILVSFLIKTFLIRSFYIPSPSMTNTLQVNDRVIVSLLSPGLIPLKNGDIVVFKDPGGWLSAEPTQQSSSGTSPLDAALSFVGLTAPDSNDHLIKRVIGLPGDRVKCCNALGQLTVNGVPLKEPYILLPPGVTRADPASFDVTVPKGKIWVMGDNRDESADSAFHYNQHTDNAFVPLSDVVGRAVVVSWPISRWTVLDDYPLTFSGVAHKNK